MFSVWTAAADNQLPNPGFEHDAAGYMIGDGCRFEERQPRFVPFGEKRALEIPFDASRDNQWDYCLRNDIGLFTPEVRVEADKEYIFEFKAKSNRDFVPLFCCEYAPFQGAISYVGRTETSVNLNREWQTIRIKVRGDTPRWSGFRIFRRLDRSPATPGEVLSLADFYFGPAGERQKGAPEELSASLSFHGDPMYLCRHPGDAPFTVDILLLNHGTQEVKKNIDFTLIGKEDGKVVRSFRKEVTFRPGRSSASFSLDIPDHNGVLKLAGAIDGKPLINALKFTVAPKIQPRKGELPIEFGINHIPSVPEPRFSIDLQMRMFSEGGFRYIRSWDTGNAFMWFRIEPKEGVFDWNRTDHMVEMAEKNGLEIFPVVAGEFALNTDQLPLGTKKPYGHNLPNWVCMKSKLIPFPNSCFGPGLKSVLPPMEVFNRMVEEMGQRYKGKIHLWEILNESELYLSPEMYIPYLQSAYRILKRIDPANIIIGGGLTGDFGSDISKGLLHFLEKGGMDYTDGLSFHPYGSLYEDQGGRMPSDMLFRNVDETFRKIGRKIPLWNTEVYYLSPQSIGGGSYHVGPVFHPGYLIRRTLIDASKGVAAIMALPGSYYLENLINDNVTGPLIGSMFANRLIPSDKYVASAVFAETLRNLKFDRIVDLPGLCRCYVFANDTKCVALLFALNPHPDDHRKIRFPDGSGVKRRNILGNPLSEKEQNMTPIPIYLIADSSEKLYSYLKALRVEGAEAVQFRGMRVTEKNDQLFLTVDAIPVFGEMLAVEGIPPVRISATQNPLRILLPRDWKPANREKREGTLEIAGQRHSFRVSREFDVPELSAAPTAQSGLDSSAWRGGLEVHPWHARARLGHFGGKLYFSVVVNDLTPFRRTDATQESLWQSDSIELFIDTIPFQEMKFARYAMKGGPTRHLYFAPPTGKHSALAGGASQEELQQINYQFMPQKSGYRFFAEIDPALFGGERGKPFGFDYAMNDWDESGRRNPSMSGFRDQCVNRMTFNVLNFVKRDTTTKR